MEPYDSGCEIFCVPEAGQTLRWVFVPFRDGFWLRRFTQGSTLGYFMCHLWRQDTPELWIGMSRNTPSGVPQKITAKNCLYRLEAAVKTNTQREYCPKFCWSC